MEQTEVLHAFMSLCQKLERMIDTNSARMETLEKKVEDLESMSDVYLTITQVAKRTGWAVSTVSNWVGKNMILSVPLPGKKTPAIPISEVKRILTEKGEGKQLRRAS